MKETSTPIVRPNRLVNVAPVQREADKNEEAETGKSPERPATTASVSSVHVITSLFRQLWVGASTLLLPQHLRWI